ncbi:hypothetical protein LOTGIDRAFT_226027 [Lottia gigantea]|uniref:Palmitoyltransferase n=1 Tax=Lottia gigantea TaxID=225164 RepID=V4AYM5_LOTGI|nr:hypothetical protein LOTGIDRAFT_226027 [Lottia gigantea]ESP00231.1 hypothetical protein LOTGIDRAFT_226027 [Lottia gigantea]
MAPSCVNTCCSAVKWSPVIFISAIVVWSYYAYVVQMCIFAVDSIPEKVIYLILYHPILIMFIWSYWQTVFTPFGRVPKSFYLSPEEADQLERETSETRQRELLTNYAKTLPVLNRTLSGAPRYCEKCHCIKPDRCHHCSVCSACVQKMDHHCPWVNNCVGFTNYKFFVQFLGYGLLYCMYIAATSLQYFILFWTVNGMGRFHILFLFFVAIMFGISLISLFGYHIFLTLQNRSTLEAFRAPIFQSGADKDGFSLGTKGNFKEVFGEDPVKWFIPVFSSIGDGVNFPTRNVDIDSDNLLGDRQRWMEEGNESGM